MATRIYLFGQSSGFQTAKQLINAQEDFVIVGESDNELTALDDIGSLKADIALYYVDGSSGVYRVAQQAYMLKPNCVNIALIPAHMRQNEIGNILQNGIHYVVVAEEATSKLIGVLKNAATIETNRMSVLRDTSSLVANCQVFTFYSPKDGLGRTTFLTNLGLLLAKQKKKVAILDFDLQFGDVNILTGIESRETVAELLQEQSNPTIEAIRQYVSIHESGLNILCAPRNPEYAEKIESSQLEKIIMALRTYYDYILIDTSKQFNDALLTCCELSTKIMFFTRADIAALKQSKKAISLLTSLGQKEKILLFLYGYDKGDRITRNDISRVLALDIWHEVPLDAKNATESINQGILLAQAYPRSVLTKSCQDAANKLIEFQNTRVPKSRKKTGRRQK